jgi:hypothetical protein
MNYFGMKIWYGILYSNRMTSYENGKIYIIKSRTSKLVYIGSTCQTLGKRFTQHKSDYKRGLTISSSRLIELGDAYIELLEEFPCDDKEDLTGAESQWMTIYPTCVNIRVEGRTPTQYYIDNRASISTRMSAYYQTIKIERAALYQTNKHKSAAYYQANKLKRKIYDHDNRVRRNATRLIRNAKVKEQKRLAKLAAVVSTESEAFQTLFNST